jgi:membrane-associated phospholipid phosphatase
METILDWGIDIIVWFQQFSPTLDLFFEFFTFLGQEEFYLILLPLIYWCLDRRTGARLIVLFLLSAYLNSLAKVWAGQPRPFTYAPDRVLALVEASGNGLPSGHTQNTVAVWGYLAAQFRRRWLWIVALLLMVLIPLSRIYLGVHFPTDLLGGYLIGVVLLLLYLWLEPRITEWLGEKALGWQLGTALVIPALMILLFFEEDGIKSGAALMGMGVGFVLERRWIRFASPGLWWKRVLRFLLGGVGLAAAYFGLRVAFSSLEPATLFRFIRYGLVGLWGGLGAPWLFTRVGLAERRAG